MLVVSGPHLAYESLRGKVRCCFSPLSKWSKQRRYRLYDIEFAEACTEVASESGGLYTCENHIS